MREEGGREGGREGEWRTIGEGGESKTGGTST